MEWQLVLRLYPSLQLSYSLWLSKAEPFPEKYFSIDIITWQMNVTWNWEIRTIFKKWSMVFSEIKVETVIFLRMVTAFDNFLINKRETGKIVHKSCTLTNHGQVI